MIAEGSSVSLNGAASISIRAGRSYIRVVFAALHLATITTTLSYPAQHDNDNNTTQRNTAHPY